MQHILSFIVVISLVVWIHELGHYLMAQACGVKVEEFSIGFGRAIISWKNKKGVLWRIGILPLGGYVKMLGDKDGSSFGPPSASVTATEQESSFFFAKPIYKTMISLSGPAANYLLALVIYTCVFALVGTSHNTTMVTNLKQNYPAQVGGIKVNDTIISIDGKPTQSAVDIKRIISLAPPNHSMHFVVNRNNSPHKIIVKNNTEKIMGIEFAHQQTQRIGFVDSIKSAYDEIFAISKMTIIAMWQMVKGERSVKELSGPIKIAQYSGKASQQGITSFLLFIAIISINLGLINLMPLPMLDGGQAIVYITETIARRRLPMIFYSIVSYAGLAILSTLMLFTIVNDISSFWVK